jgi:hypothetical protein
VRPRALPAATPAAGRLQAEVREREGKMGRAAAVGEAVDEVGGGARDGPADGGRLRERRAESTTKREP